MADTYAICPGCNFGIEINVQLQPEGQYSEFSSPDGHCYYCAHSTKRTGIKETLDSARVLLASAQRVKNYEAEQFYSHQVKRCEQALNITHTQGSLF